MCADRSRQPIVHLVGSIPLPDAETVFRTLSAAVGRHLIRIPDGETGIRKTWIKFLQDVLAANPAIEAASDVPPFRFVQWDGKLIREIPRLRVRPGAEPDPAGFKTGYADMAIESWAAVRPPAAGGRDPGRRQVPGEPADAHRADLQQHAAGRPSAAAAGPDAPLHRRGRAHRGGDPQRAPRPAMGRVPGGAGVGGLLRAGPGRLPHRDDRRTYRGR